MGKIVFYYSDERQSSVFDGRQQGKLWNGMEWKMVLNGRRILVWDMEDVQNGMEWNGRFEKWNGRPSSILTTHI